MSAGHTHQRAAPGGRPRLGPARMSNSDSLPHALNRKIVISGIEIRERVVGQGRPLLMIHGWGAHIDLLQPLVSWLGRYDYRLYMFDLPGFGESAEPAAPLSIFDYARFCCDYLDYHGLRRVHYFGHSMGGRIGLALGSGHGHRIEKMVLSNSAGVKNRPPFHSRLRLRCYKSVRDGLGRLGADGLAERLAARYHRRYGSSDFQQASAVMRQTLVKVVEQDLLGHAARVAIPTVLLWGDQDQETPLWMGRKLESAMLDAALVVYEGAGHYAYLDFPEKTARIMDALFGG